MSMLQTVKIKLGGAVDKFKNFIFDASRLDGVFDLKRESGETIFSIDANNNLNIPGYIFPGMMQVGNNDSDDNNFVFDATADNGTMLLKRASGQDILSVDIDGKVAFPNNVVPAFSAKNLAIQMLTNNVYTRFLFPTEVFDTNNSYDPATSLFNPKVAGYYQINFMAFLSADDAVYVAEVSLRKNGVDILATSRSSTPTTQSIWQVRNINHLEYFNGTTDYVEIFGRIAGSGPVYVQGAAGTPSLFSGFLARVA